VASTVTFCLSSICVSDWNHVQGTWRSERVISTRRVTLMRTARQEDLLLRFRGFLVLVGLEIYFPLEPAIHKHHVAHGERHSECPPHQPNCERVRTGERAA